MSFSFRVTEHDDDRRLDKIIRSRWPEIPLSAVMKAIRKGQVRVDARKGACSDHVFEGQEIHVPWDPPRKKDFGRKLGGLDVIYRDKAILVINKPVGLLVQPDRKGGDSVITRAWQSFGDEDFRPQSVHRLDRNTTGALLLAMNGRALRDLNRVWRDGNITKTYWAIVVGRTPLKGEIDVPLLKDGNRNIVKADPEGVPALTRFRRLFCDEDLSLVEVELVTGRSHQIRVHFAHIGNPILGDPKYGDARINGRWIGEGIRRPLLHARKLSMHGLMEMLPLLDGRHFVAPVSADFAEILRRRGWRP